MAIRLGTNGADTLGGTTLSDLIDGGFGNDTLTTGGGADEVFAGLGDDVINVTSGNVTVSGGGGSDTVNLTAGDWSLGLPSADGTLSIYNAETEEVLTLSDVEFVRIGSNTVSFRSGTDGADTLAGTAGEDFISAQDGNDSVSAANGDDWVSGGGGADTVNAGEGNDIIDERRTVTGGQPGSQVVANDVDAGAGNDVVVLGLSAHDTLGATETYDIEGGAGTDIVYLHDWAANAFDAVTNGSGGAQILITRGSGTAPFATLNGIEQVVDIANNVVWTANGSGVFTESRPEVEATTNATVNGTGLSEDIVGNAQDNTLSGGGGFDRFTGGAGTDTVLLNGLPRNFYFADRLDPIKTSGGFTGIKLVNIADPRQPALLIATDIEKITFVFGTGADDDLTFNLKFVTTGSFTGVGTAENDFVIVDTGLAFAAGTELRTLAGRDRILGEGDIDLIDSGAGLDRIDWRLTTGGAQILGGDGSDRLFISTTATALGNVTIDGGNGSDAIVFDSTTLTASLIGGSGDDAFFTGLNGSVAGGAGNDRIFVAFDDDSRDQSTVTGGDGEDVLVLDGSIADYLISKLASGDIRIESKETGQILTVQSTEALRFDDLTILSSSVRTDGTFNGDGDADTLNGTAGIDLINGDAGNDSLTAAAGNDIVAGDAGNDTMDGGDGNDILSGGAGGDSVTGGVGDDELAGGTGDDRLAGGAGVDSFIFAGDAGVDIGDDTVADFTAGAGIGDVLVLNRDLRAFDSFAELLAAATQSGANTVITIDADNQITLLSVDKTDLVADDFLFV